MDIARPNNPSRERIRHAAYITAGAAVVLLIALGVSRLQPAVPVVDRATLWIDTVKRGAMVREVRCTGMLVSEDTRWIPATTSGRVEQIVLRPGTVVDATTVILELSNPALQQELQDAQLRVKSAEADLLAVRAQLESEQLQQQASTASIEADLKKAILQADVNEQLAAKQLVSALLLTQSRLDAQQLASRYAIATRQVAKSAESMSARLVAHASDTDQIRALMQLKGRQVNDLSVRAGISGVLQFVSVELGQQVSPGTNLARVSNPSRLKAELQIPETQAKDVQIGQRALIDTRNGVIAGAVVRVAPSVQNGTVAVDVTFRVPLPKGARPELTVDGTIEIERVNDTIYVGRPASAQEHSIVNLFTIQKNGNALRVPVAIGRSSTNSVEVLSGLQVGDQVILSDMSAWDNVHRVQLQ